MRWLALITSLLIATSAGARLDEPEDESKSGLVRLYMSFPCDALEDSITFVYNELKLHAEHLVKCHEHFDASDYKYKKLVCLYVRVDWQNMYEHLASIRKAHDLTCDGDTKKNPQYDIEF